MSALAEAPTLTRDNALAVASQHRLERADLRLSIKPLGYHGGLARVAELLIDPPAAIHTLDVEKLLLWVPRFGGAIVRDILETLELSPIKRVGTLTDRQRLVLARYILADNDRERIAVLMERSTRKTLSLPIKRVLRIEPSLCDNFAGTVLADLGVTLDTPLLALNDEQHHALTECLGAGLTPATAGEAAGVA